MEVYLSKTSFLAKTPPLSLRTSASECGNPGWSIKAQSALIWTPYAGANTRCRLLIWLQNYKITISKKSTLSPGHQRKHYSPKKPLRINVNKIKNDEGLLNFGLNNLKSKIINLNLSKKSDLIEASNKFYHYLNLIDNSNCKTIAVAPIPSEGLGKVINDRLMKAIVE